MTDDPMKYYQDQSDEFHLFVGYCISKWALIDDQLFCIFRDCVGPYEQCAIIYYRTPGLEVRLGLTEEIVMSVLPPPDVQSGHAHEDCVKFKKIAKKFRDLLAVRRRIAHHPVIGRSGYFFDRPLTKQQEFWLEISPSAHEQKRKQDGKNGLTLNDLKQHLKDTWELDESLHQFLYVVLQKQPEAPPRLYFPPKEDQD